MGMLMLLSPSGCNVQICSCFVTDWYVWHVRVGRVFLLLLPHHYVLFCFVFVLFLFFFVVVLLYNKNIGDEPEHSNPNSVEFFVAKMAYQAYCEYQKQLLNDINGARTYVWKLLYTYVCRCVCFASLPSPIYNVNHDTQF